MKKRILSLLLVLMLAVTMIPAAGAANRNPDAPTGSEPFADFLFSYEDFFAHRQLGTTFNLRAGYYAENLTADVYWSMAFFKGSIDEIHDDDVPFLLTAPKPLKQNGYNELSYAWNTSGLKAGVYTVLVLAVDKNGNPLEGDYSSDYTVINLDSKAKHITGAFWADSYAEYMDGNPSEMTGPIYLAKGAYNNAPLAAPKPWDATDYWTAAYSTTTPNIIRVGKEYGCATIEGLNYGIGTLVGKVAGYTITMNVEVCTSGTGHHYNTTVITPATETSYGTARNTCESCGYSYEVKNYHGCSTAGYTDVPKPGNWAHLPIDYVVSHKLMTGTTATTFKPKEILTRAQLATLLYNLAGKPKVTGTCPFTDLTKDWYRDAVIWAYQNHVFMGATDTLFDPNSPANRQMFVATLYRYYTDYLHKTARPGGSFNQFSDAGKVSSYAVDAVAWAVNEGLLNGSGGKLLPKDNIVREQAATFIMYFDLFCKK